MFSALRHRNYRLFWIGQVISVTGTFMQSTAQQWLVLTLTTPQAAPLALGVVGALQFGPLLVMTPFSGLIADRWPRRNILVATQSASAALALLLWALTALHVAQLWHVYALALLLGLVNAIDMPTRQAFVSEMVPGESLLNAVALNSAQFNVARIVGPGLAGLTIALLGVPPLFLLNALSFLAVIGGLYLMRSDELFLGPRVEATHGLARIRALGDGARFVLADPTLRVSFLLITVIGTMGFNFNVLLPLEAEHTLHAGPSVFGLLTSALGAGALVGALFLARRGGKPTNRLLAVAGATFGALEAAVAFSHSVVVAMLLIAATGFAMSVFSASANTRTQLASPAQLRGRVMSVYTMVFMGTTPIGNLLVSGAASGGGVPASFLVSGLPCLASALVAAWLWRRQEQAAPMPVAPVATSASAAIPVNAVEAVAPAEPDVEPDTAPQGALEEATRSAGSSSRGQYRAPGRRQPQPLVADPE